jgi:hypothetical protein
MCCGAPNSPFRATENGRPSGGSVRQGEGGRKIGGECQARITQQISAEYPKGWPERKGQIHQLDRNSPRGFPKDFQATATGFLLPKANRGGILPRFL